MNERLLRDRQAYEKLSTIVFTANLRGEIDWVSPLWYARTGLSPDETLGEAWVSVVHPDDIEHAVYCWTTAIDTREPFFATVRTRCADGRYRWFLSEAHIVEEAGYDAYWLGMTKDLTPIPFIELEATDAEALN